jgi:peptidoglycan/xylan/chitin deacetylase (PgdA/CDA1 family)
MVQLSLIFFANGQDRAEALRPDVSKGALVLTFDDAFTAQWVAALPIFTQQAARVTFFVSNADRLNPGQVADLKTLRQAGHAIGCHGLRHQKAVDYAAAHGMARYRQDEIEPANAALAGMGFTPSAFAYPSSQHSPETDAELLKHFRHLRSGAGAAKPGQAVKDMDLIFVPAAEIARTGRLLGAGIDYTDTGGKYRPVGQVLEALDRAKAREEIICLYAHNISTNGPGHHLQPDVLRRILAHAKAIGLPAVSYDDLP